MLPCRVVSPVVLRHAVGNLLVLRRRTTDSRRDRRVSPFLHTVKQVTLNSAIQL